MPSDPFAHIHPRDPVRVSATAWNAMLDAARAAQNGLGAPSSATGQARQGEIVRVVNDTGVDLPRCAVVGLGDPVIEPGVDLDGFLREVAFRATAPGPLHVGRFAILLDPCREGGVARAHVAGVCPVRVDVTPDADAYGYDCADLGASGTMDHLQVVRTGSAKVLWREGERADGDAYYDVYGQHWGRQWALVRFGTVCGSCIPELIISFGAIDRPVSVGEPGIAWILYRVVGFVETEVARGTTDSTGYILHEYTPTGPGESYVLEYVTPVLAGQFGTIGHTTVRATVLPENTSHCRHWVSFCPSCVFVRGCCATTHSTVEPYAYVDGDPLVEEVSWGYFEDADFYDNAHYSLGCIYLPEGTYLVHVEEPSLPQSYDQNLYVDCFDNVYSPYATANLVRFNLNWIDPYNDDVGAHLGTTLTLKDGTGEDVTLTRPAPPGVPSRFQKWFGCKVMHNISTHVQTIRTGTPPSRCDVHFTVWDRDCLHLAQSPGVDIALGYLFDGCTLTIYAVRCLPEPSYGYADDCAPSASSCDDILHHLADPGYSVYDNRDLQPLVLELPADTGYGPYDDGYFNCYHNFYWSASIDGTPHCFVGDPLVQDPMTLEIYQVHFADGCHNVGFDVDTIALFYPGVTRFEIMEG